MGSPGGAPPGWEANLRQHEASKKEKHLSREKEALINKQREVLEQAQQELHEKQRVKACRIKLLNKIIRIIRKYAFWVVLALVFIWMIPEQKTDYVGMEYVD